MSKPSLETLLVPDEAAQRRQKANPNVDVERQFSEHGRREFASWFHANYESDPSLFVDMGHIHSAFLARFQDEGISSYDFVLGMLIEITDTYDGDAPTGTRATPGHVFASDPYCRVRKRSALTVQSGAIFVRPIDWLIQDIIPRGSIVLVAGASNDAKTWCAMSLEKAIAHRGPWLGRAFDPLGHFDDQRPRVLHVDFEMGADEVERRLALLGDAEGHVMRTSHSGVPLSDERFWISLDAIKPDVVCVDSLSNGNPGVDEKDSRFAEPLARAGRYAAVHGTTFLFVHHSPKCTGTESLLEIARGSSAIPANIDVAFFVKKVSRFATKDPKERRSIVICKKMRRGGSEPEPFTVRLTDERGLELYEERRGRPAVDKLSDEDAVFVAVEASPGIGGKRQLSKAAGLSVERVVIARAKLLDAERIENRGTDAKPSLFARAA